GIPPRCCATCSCPLQTPRKGQSHGAHCSWRRTRGAEPIARWDRWRYAGLAWLTADPPGVGLCNIWLPPTNTGYVPGVIFLLLRPAPSNDVAAWQLLPSVLIPGHLSTVKHRLYLHAWPGRSQ